MSELKSKHFEIGDYEKFMSKIKEYGYNKESYTEKEIYDIITDILNIELAKAGVLCQITD